MQRDSQWAPSARKCSVGDTLCPLWSLRHNGRGRVDRVCKSTVGYLRSAVVGAPVDPPILLSVRPPCTLLVSRLPHLPDKLLKTAVRLRWGGGWWGGGWGGT